MAQWEAMRQCFCVFWLENTNSRNSSSSSRSRQSETETTNTTTNISTSFDQMCSSLWGSSTSFSPSHANVIEELLYTRVAVFICCFGLLGNAVNLVVLSTQGHHTHQSGRMQLFARIGLMALAVADSLFCLSILPHAFVERDPVTTSINFSLVYSAYGDSVINTFAMIGTWLTVAMATGRYAAVCHPFQARVAIGRTVALWLIAVVCFACVAFNVPRFFINTIETCPLWSGASLVGNQSVYFRWFGPMHTTWHRNLELGYVWIYFLVSVMVPLVVLVFTGGRLTCFLRRGRLDLAGTEERAAAAVDLGRFQDVDRSFTITLVAVALMHTILVSPAELINFLRGHLLQPDHTDNGYQVYNLLVSVLNTLQAVNYSFNFLLYCAVNVAFRRRFVQMVSCRRQAETQNRLRLQMLAHSGLLSECSGDSNGRRSYVQRRLVTADANCRRALSDFIN